MEKYNNKTDQDARGRSEQDLLLDIVLYPHRSLSAKQFFILMGVIIFLSFSLALCFTLNGAWPVFFFFGLEVFVIFQFFRLNYKQAKIREKIKLNARELRVEEINADGESRIWSFTPHWVKVVLDNQQLTTNQGALRILSRGQGVAIGSFLSPAERAELKSIIEDALRPLRV